MRAMEKLRTHAALCHASVSRGEVLLSGLVLGRSAASHALFSYCAQS